MGILPKGPLRELLAKRSPEILPFGHPDSPIVMFVAELERQLQDEIDAETLYRQLSQSSAIRSRLATLSNDDPERITLAILVPVASSMLQSIADEEKNHQRMLRDLIGMLRHE